MSKISDKRERRPERNTSNDKKYKTQPHYIVRLGGFMKIIGIIRQILVTRHISFFNLISYFKIGITDALTFQEIEWGNIFFMSHF